MYISGLQFCCEDMSINFFEGSIKLNTKRIMPELEISNLEIPIKYCPFCGTIITVVAKNLYNDTIPVTVTIKNGFTIYQDTAKDVWEIEHGLGGE
jgi:hypothetical protein